MQSDGRRDGRGDDPRRPGEPSPTAKFNLDNTVIRAPISGKTGGLLVKRGNLVRSGGAAPLVVINQVRPIHGALRGSVVAASDSCFSMAPTADCRSRRCPAVSRAPTPSIDSLAAEAMAKPIRTTRRARPHAAGTRRRCGSRGRTAATAVVTLRARAATARCWAVAPAARCGGSNRRSKRSDRTGVPSDAPRQCRNGCGGRRRRPDDRRSAAGAIVGRSRHGQALRHRQRGRYHDGTVQLKATFDNMSGRLWAGQFVPTSLHLFDEDNALVVPSQAVVTGQRGAYVYIVDRRTPRASVPSSSSVRRRSRDHFERRARR